MNLLCLRCGNATYFETEVETVVEVTVIEGGIKIENALYPDLDYTAETLGDNLNDLLEYTDRQAESDMLFDADTDTYYSRYFKCARCGHNKVAPPLKPKRPELPLADELAQHHEEYSHLRKERQHYADNLSGLREQ
jgi:hypothetical protein